MIIQTCPKCGADLHEMMLASAPPIHVKECLSCGYRYERREEVIRVPFVEPEEAETTTTSVPISPSATRCVPVSPSDASFQSSACIHCSNHPKNGGSGICHCTLGTPVIN